MAVLTSFSLPSLASVPGALTLSAALATSVDLSSLSYVVGAVSFTFNVLTTLSLPAAKNFTSTFAITAPSMTTFSFNSGLLQVGGNVTMSGMALNQASVDGILVSLAALNGSGGTTSYNNFTVNVSGGSSSTPSATGLAAKVTLVARGCTVTNN
jgi:hypothetical protein